MSAQINPPPTQPNRRLMLLGTLSVGAGLGYHLLRPPAVDNRQRAPRIDLEALVPKVIGGWRSVDQVVQAVNPETQALLDRLYSQILGRTYVNREGYAVMLSISYGADQRGSMEAHKPEVCYPAQGFKVTSNTADTLDTAFGAIQAKRLDTNMGSRREPLTYWFTVGENAVTNRFQKRLVEMKMIITGEIPDGLLFRVSSIDQDPQHAWAMQDAFVTDLLAEASPSARKRLAGL